MTGFEKIHSGGPLYQFVQRQILDALARGEWRPDEAIPSEKRLCERFGVSIGTLRKAIDGLVADQILVRQQGLGTFVASQSRPRQTFPFFNISGHDGLRTYPHVDLVSFNVGQADRTAAEKLEIDLQADVFEMKHLLSIAGTAVMVNNVTIPAARFKDLTEQVVRERTNALYSLYLEGYGVNVVHIDERIRAVPADDSTAALLGLTPGDPILEVRRVAYTFNQQPVEWCISQVNTAHHEYVYRSAADRFLQEP